MPEGQREADEKEVMKVLIPTGIRRRAMGGVVFAVALLLAFPAGCGRKGSPVPPELPRLPAVENLQAQRVNGQVELSWGISEKEKNRSDTIAGFYIYRAEGSASGDDCKDTPRRFRQVGKVVHDKGGTDPETWHFDDTPPPDAVVFYNIRSFRETGEPGPESETVCLPLE